MLTPRSPVPEVETDTEWLAFEIEIAKVPATPPVNRTRMLRAVALPDAPPPTPNDDSFQLPDTRPPL